MEGSIAPKDIIIAINGKKVESVAKLLARIDDFNVGDVVTLTIFRNEQIHEVDITLQPGV